MLGIQRYQEVIRRLWWVLISILLLGAGFLGYHLGEEVDPHTLVVRIVNAKNFESEQKAYESLIEQVGPEEAQELLYRSGLPFDGATHLLNHTVGIYLYRHEGLSGITT